MHTCGGEAARHDSAPVTWFVATADTVAAPADVSQPLIARSVHSAEMYSYRSRPCTSWRKAASGRAEHTLMSMSLVAFDRKVNEGRSSDTLERPAQRLRRLQSCCAGHWGCPGPVELEN